jgi:hypothetical protein
VAHSPDVGRVSVHTHTHTAASFVSKQDTHFLLPHAASFQRSAVSLVGFTGLKLSFQEIEENGDSVRRLLADYFNDEVPSSFEKFPDFVLLRND